MPPRGRLVRRERGFALMQVKEGISAMHRTHRNGAKAAVARIHLNQAPSPEILRDIESSTSDILEVTLIPIPL